MNMDVTNLATSLFRRLLVTVYPPRCVLCGAAGMDDMDICERCYRKLPWLESACTQCALPLAVHSGNRLKCGRCLQKTPAFDNSLSLFSYEQDVIKLVHQLKFNEKLVCARLLGGMLVEAIKQHETALPDCILPVPLYRTRLRRRGFNQSIELARPVARAFRLPLEIQSVIRRRDTHSQTGLNKKQRRRNIRGAFKTVRSLDYDHVAILDDVVTTTSTVNELASLVKKAGVRRVDVWSIARAK